MRRACTAAFVASLAACSGHAGTGPAAQGGTDGGQGLSIGGDARDAAAGSLHVAIAASATEVCPGQCVDLTAVASGGLAPYTYSWSNDVVGAPQHVCPQGSTSYAVAATDSSGSSGELGKPPAGGSASIAIAVASSCSSDGGAGSQDAIAADVVAGPPLPATGLSLQCSISWPATDGAAGYPNVRGENTAVAVDSAGDMVVAGSFLGSITIGGRAISAVGIPDLVVIKLDSQCHVLWSKQVGASGASVYPSAVAFDASGDVVVGGSFYTTSSIPFIGSVDFGTGGHASASSAAFVFKLDTAGNTSWANVYAGNGSGFDFAVVEDLAVRAGSDVIVAVRSDSPIDFGSGVVPIVDAGTTAGGGDYYLVELGASGALTFAKPSEAFEPAPWMMESVDTAPDGSIWLGGTVRTDTVVQNQSGSSTLYAVHLDASATVLSSQALMAAASTPWNGAAVRVGPGGDAVVSAAWAADGSGLSWTWWLEGLTPQGATSWTYPSLSSYGSSTDPAEVARVDAYGRVWTAGEFAGSLTLGAPAGTLTSGANTTGVDVVTLGGGSALSGSTVPTLAGGSVDDMALAPGGEIVLAGWTGMGTGSSANLFVSKLGF